MTDLSDRSLVCPAKVVLGPLKNHPVQCGRVEFPLWIEILGIGRRNESLLEAVERPACLDALLDNGLFGSKSELSAPRVLDVELQQGLVLFLDEGIVLAQPNSELEVVDMLVEALLIVCQISEAGPSA